MAKVEKKLRVHNIIRYEMIFFFLFFYIPLLYRSGFGGEYYTYSLSLTSKQFDAIIDRNRALLHYLDFVFILISLMNQTSGNAKATTLYYLIRNAPFQKP
ncbi:hypothetical protein [uncultured Bacteroides sp.]|uniref:hypothetical protein n=1 Tax=uncultured Bacteroides sp. TaxID=162156 RepID=UPI0027D96379|nr:hypothetical protein [uncultured Bacteroides sp.]